MGLLWSAEVDHLPIDLKAEFHSIKNPFVTHTTRTAIVSHQYYNKSQNADRLSLIRPNRHDAKIDFMAEPTQPDSQHAY